MKFPFNSVEKQLFSRQGLPKAAQAVLDRKSQDYFLS